MTKILRCAIYTRKSSEEGLEQDFNSLDAQLEACEAFIKSQKHEGWELIEKQYNDGGYSGGTMNRPAFNDLLQDIENDKVDIVVVYKVDRLTRSLMDFAKIVEVFDKHSTSFVSITQQFNTTTSMGRLTLNILLSFAQFEREVTGERIRDKFAATKKKGIWVGGKPPMGYVKVDGYLEVVEKEADIIRLIFNKYLELGTVAKLVEYLKTNKIFTRKGGIFFKGHLYQILANKAYIGKIVHKSNVYEGLHEPIIPEDLFNKVQELLAKNALARKNSTNAKSASLLKGKLFDDKENYMSPSHSNKQGKRYRYYVSQAQIQNRIQDIGSVSKIPVAEIESFVTEKIKEYVSDKTHLQNLFKDDTFYLQKTILEQFNPQILDVNFIRHTLIKVKISENSVEIILSNYTLKESIEYQVYEKALPDKQKYDQNSLVKLNYNIRISGTTKNGNKLIIGEVRHKTLNKTLVDALAKCFYYHKLMFENKLTSKEKSNSYINKIMQLRFLPKDIIKSILNGEQEPDLTLDKLYQIVYHRNGRSLNLKY